MPDKKDAVLGPQTELELVQTLWKVIHDLSAAGMDLDPKNLGQTPVRVVRSYQELFSGLLKDPAEVLKTSFPDGSYDELVTVCNIDFVSICAHHFLPFVGYCHFGYLPDKKVVGLSKIPRMVDILARRPQIQESLTRKIADTFQEVVEPRGCAVSIDAWHSCVSIRGVQKPRAMMRTTALTGWFLEKHHLKREFFDTINLEIRKW
jgi:GTP cyclohydrolase I